MISRSKGLTLGIISGMLWGLDTVLIGIILSSSSFLETQMAIFLDRFISYFLHDIFSSLWIMVYM